FFGELAVPLAAYAISLGVVILLRVSEFLFVIGLRLAGAQRFGDGQHDLLEVRLLSGGDAFRVVRLPWRHLLRGRSTGLWLALPDFDHPRCDLSWNETGCG